MANPEHLAILKEGVAAWNGWRGKHKGLMPDLTSADFTRLNLRGANLHSADLTRANLTEANLRDANLIGTDLTRANLSHANLFGANLHAANLTRTTLGDVNFGEAVLSRANLIGAELNDTDFSHALFSGTILGSVDLRKARGLEKVRHRGSSLIGIDTIYLSQASIPEAFLRGCGVPDDFIEYSKSLAAKPVGFYSCFISYSTKDQQFADRLFADLQDTGVRCWFAPHDVQGGRKLHEQIDEAIRLHDKLLLILSPHSMASEWVKTEISKARKREVRDKGRVLFPLSLAPFDAICDWEFFDADTGKDSAREIREYFIPDFSNWTDHDSYQKAFGRLLKDLRAASKAAEAAQS